jgi:hypothetical protein
MSGPYEHAINVNVGGTGAHPIVTVWCMDCVETVGDFGQNAPYAELVAAVTAHRATMSKRETYRRQREEGQQ